MTISGREKLADLPLNELLIKLEKPPYVTAPNPFGQTVVDIGLYVYEIAHIDPAENTYVMEGFVDLVWCDPRLRFELNESDPLCARDVSRLKRKNAQHFYKIGWDGVYKRQGEN